MRNGIFASGESAVTVLRTGATHVQARKREEEESMKRYHTGAAVERQAHGFYR